MKSEQDDILRFYVIYDNAREMPQCVIVRGWTIKATGEQVHDPGCVAWSYYVPGITPEQRSELRDTAIRSARRHCTALGFTAQIARSEQDDPAILESWL